MERRLKNYIQHAGTTAELGAKTANELQPEDDTSLKSRKFMNENERIRVFSMFLNGDHCTSAESLCNHDYETTVIHNVERFKKKKSCVVGSWLGRWKRANTKSCASDTSDK